MEIFRKTARPDLVLPNKYGNKFAIRNKTLSQKAERGVVKTLKEIAF